MKPSSTRNTCGASQQSQFAHRELIGGGLASLTLSTGLTPFGISHMIYEAAICYSEIGTGIATDPNFV